MAPGRLAWFALGPIMSYFNFGIIHPGYSEPILLRFDKIGVRVANLMN